MKAIVTIAAEHGGCEPLGKNRIYAEYKHQPPNTVPHAGLQDGDVRDRVSLIRSLATQSALAFKEI